MKNAVIAGRDAFLAGRIQNHTRVSRLTERWSVKMNKPIFYKSFRSRNFQGLDVSNISVADESSNEENIILDIGFGTGDSTIFLRKYFLSIKYTVLKNKPGVKYLRDQKIDAEYGDAADIIEKFKDKTVSQIYMLFPPMAKISIESEDYSMSIFLAKYIDCSKEMGCFILRQIILIMH